jgi:hypothetical protein
MSDPQPIHVGEVLRGIRAADHNGFYETWRKVNQLPPSATNGRQSTTSNRLVVSVFNEGVAINTEFPVLKLTSPVFTPTDRANVIWEPIAFNGDTPDADTTIADICIVQGPIGTGLMGRGHGVISGPTYCKVEVSDAAHTHAKPTDGENTKLESGTSGAKIVWKESGTGTKKALVMLGGGGSGASVPRALLRATASIPAGTGDPRSPGLSTDFEQVLGDTISGDIENWSQVLITDNSYMVVIDIGAHNVIVSAFC